MKLTLVLVPQATVSGHILDQLLIILLLERELKQPDILAKQVETVLRYPSVDLKLV
jgi:hypothetical protein